MIVLMPDAQLVSNEDWPLITTLLGRARLDAVDLVEVFTVNHNRQPCGAFRLAAPPVALHVSQRDARHAADQLRKRGRTFTIQRVPGLLLEFGRRSLLLPMMDAMDWRQFMRPEVRIAGNVMSPERFTRPPVLLNDLTFMALEPMLLQRLLPGQMFYGCMALADSYAPWASWQGERLNRWVSMVESGVMNWLDISECMPDGQFALQLGAQAAREWSALMARDADAYE